MINDAQDNVIRTMFFNGPTIEYYYINGYIGISQRIHSIRIQQEIQAFSFSIERFLFFFFLYNITLSVILSVSRKHE